MDDCDRYVSGAVEHEDMEVLIGKHARIVCADDQNIVVDIEGRKYVISWGIDCVYSDCSGEDDPHVFLEVMRIADRSA